MEVVPDRFLIRGREVGPRHFVQPCGGTAVVAERVTQIDQQAQQTIFVLGGPQRGNLCGLLRPRLRLWGYHLVPV